MLSPALLIFQTKFTFTYNNHLIYKPSSAPDGYIREGAYPRHRNGKIICIVLIFPEQVAYVITNEILFFQTHTVFLLMKTARINNEVNITLKIVAKYINPILVVALL